MTKKELPINTVVCGDALTVLKTFPSKSIDCCITSPPYWGLRDYGFEQMFGGDKNCEHEWGNKIKFKGNVPHHGESSNVMEILSVTKDARNRQWSSGNICSKCQAWKGQLGLEPTPEMYIEHLAEIFNEAKRVLKKEGTLWLVIGDTYSANRTYQVSQTFSGVGGEVENKRYGGHGSKVPRGMQPKCLCMIPERLAWSLIQNGWILRNKIPWIKPNCMPSSVKDRYANKWEYVYYFVKSQRNYFDLDAVREPYTEPLNRWGGDNLVAKGKSTWDKGTGQETYRDRNMRPNSDGKNPGDVWIINTVPCPVKGIHFATFPEELCKKAIIPGCPEGGIVLDPFCGIGTACYVAQRLGRKFIGIDIKPEYCDKAENIRLAQGVL